MASRRRVLGVLLGIAAIPAIAIALLVTYIHIERHKAERRLVHLLCETDYQALLEACREISRRAATGELEARAYSIRRHPGRYSFPKAILDVGPLFVRIDGEGLVWVELFWLPSQGALAYPEGYHGDHREGDKELVPGLWFYDEYYDSDHPKFMKYIDGLIDEGRKSHLH